MPTRILISHLAGSKTNQVEQFPIESFPELSIGRETGAAILFDPARDDAVSRRHAVIKVAQGDPPNFKLSDLGSSNGTFLNGKRIAAETELLPGDTIELGAGGPKFVFDLDPRPSNLAARTRVIDAGGSAATRVIGTGEGTRPAGTTIQRTLPEARPSVGRETVMRLLSEQKQATSRVGLYVLAGVIAVILLAGGAIYYKNQRDVAAEAAQLAEINAKQITRTQELATQIQQQQKEIGLSVERVVDRYANSTVLISMKWRLVDRDTGRPLFHKTVFVPGAGWLPAYVEWQGGLYRWLTLEDEQHQNKPVGAEGIGTGFVVHEQGLIVTNKHVAAGWLINYNQFSDYETGRGVYFKEQDQPYKTQDEYWTKNPMRTFDLTEKLGLFQKAISWVPDEGGPIYHNDQPVRFKGDLSAEGRSEELSVRFPGTRVDVNARLVGYSKDADAALIKIDATQTLATMPIAADDNVKEGERVIVLGYPNFTAENIAVYKTSEHGEIRQHSDVIPQPTATTGNISNISLALQQQGNVTVGGAIGHAYQLTVPSGRGNSGGPVFNAEGKVIGLFTYGSARETVTYAVPIKYARELLQMQRTFN